MAPISAFARVLNAIKEEKEKGGEAVTVESSEEVTETSTNE